MSNSTRRTQYIKELNKTRLTARVIVLHNKGYKKCNKPGVDTPAIDLWHANLYAAKRANELVPGQPVFIVEDDVEFTDNISKFSDSIEDFFLNKSEPSALLHTPQLLIKELVCYPFKVKIILFDKTMIKLLQAVNNEAIHFKLVNIKTIGNIIHADLEYMKRKCSWSYMDDELRKYCTALAIFLRDEREINCFFNIENGKFTLIN